jgi:RimJ/RimL family protein N-acetyltransferase
MMTSFEGAATGEFGFIELKVVRVYAETISKNKAAIRLRRSVGMCIESERGGDRIFKGRTWSTTVLAIDEFAWCGR